MIDLAVITSTVARDRVAQQFATRPAAAPARHPRVRGAAIRALRAVADLLEPTPRHVAHA